MLDHLPYNLLINAMIFDVFCLSISMVLKFYLALKFIHPCWASFELIKFPIDSIFGIAVNWPHLSLGCQRIQNVVIFLLGLNWKL